VAKVFIVSIILLSTLGACASLPTQVERKSSFALQDTAATQLGRAMQKRTAAHPEQSGFYLLGNGLDAFVARAVLATHAERSIDAQYYLLHNDLVGGLFLDTLVMAADRGVRVRLLIDDMALDDNKDIGAAALDAHPNIEIRVFNPFDRGFGRGLQLLTRFGEVTRRMHNKSFTVDNQLTIVGGRNIGNEYFEADPDLAFGDLDVLATGPVVNEVSSSFDLYWNAPVSYPVASLVKGNSAPENLAKMQQALTDFVSQQLDSVYLRALQGSRLAHALRNQRLEFEWGSADVVYDDPAKITADRDQTGLRLATKLKPYTDQIAKELTIFSPYFVPGKEGVAKLRELRERGVRVRILTNSLASTDVSAVHAGYAKYRKSMLRAGIELYEMDKTLTREQRRDKKGPGGSSKASLHAKSFVIDRERVFIGSMNLDPRSIVENTEVGLMVESVDIAAGMADWFDQTIDKIAFRLELRKGDDGSDKLLWHRKINGESFVYTTEPNTSFWRRLGVGLLRLFPIEAQL